MQDADSVRRNLAYTAVALLVAMALVATGVAALIRAEKPELPARQEVAVTPSPAPSPSPSAVPSPSPLTRQMAALSAGLPANSVSMAARNLTTGATLAFGASGGLTTASAAKVDILATLLLRQQASGATLTGDEDSEATSMIEESDDAAADALWTDIGGASAMAAANRRLGVGCTVPGQGPAWGLTTTCALGQIQLLYQLESTSSPLDESSRDYILNLMENVAPSEAWGIPVVADSGTRFAVKNGWLNVDGATDWAVTSDGIVTYQGQTLLISVLTQNEGRVYSGIDLIQRLAPLMARSVAT